MPVIVSPTSRLLFAAIQAKLDPASIRELVTLQREEEAKQAELSFNKAMAEFQSIVPVIPKSKLVEFVSRKTGSTVSYSYAPLETILESIKEPLRKCGLSISWDSQTIDSKAMRVTCRVQHKAGHSRVSEFTVPIGGVDLMSEPQKAASAWNYSRRVSLMSVLGLVAGETDDDGQSAVCDDPEPQARAEVSQKAVDQLRAELTIKGLTSSQVDEWIGLELKMNPELHKDASNWTKSDMDRCRAKWRKCYPREAN